MSNASMLADYLKDLSPEELRSGLAQFLPEGTSRAERIATVEGALRSSEADLLRAELGRWIVDRLVPVAALVPKRFAMWREPTRASMLFVISRLSVERLAPKLVEQFELPLNTSPEVRLLKLIARVPGLQKLGQVLARNRHIRRTVRAALAKLENGIRDVEIEDVLASVRSQLGRKIDEFGIEIERKLLSEASVSAVVRFTWWNDQKNQRERGVFKVLKPHIPACFAEDMKILQDLADCFGKQEREGFASAVIPDTFSKIRQHLQHEVDFPGEQAALVEAARQLRTLRGVRVPKLIPQFCTDKLTAMSEEAGVKVTAAAVHMPLAKRERVAQQLVEALVAFPLLSRQEKAIFHADPHAGNLLYDRRTGELVLLDWALADRLNSEQRRRLMLLFSAVAFRNPAAAVAQIEALSEVHNAANAKKIRAVVVPFLDQLPVTRWTRAVDAMTLLQDVAMSGVRFPSSLIMFSKVLFTLDGMLDDIRGYGTTAEFTIARYLFQRWLRKPLSFALPLGAGDWLGMEMSVLLYGGRLAVRCEESLYKRMFHPRNPAAML